MHPKKAIILAKVETTYGVDALPTPANNAMLAYELKYELTGEKKPRDPVKPWYGMYGGVNVYEGQKISFSVELKASGSAGVPPRIGALLRACNMAEVIAPGLSVAYNPLSTQSTAESVTIYYYLDGKLYKLRGARGTFKSDFTVNEICKLDFEFTGLYEAPTTAALPTPTFETGYPNIFANAYFDYDSLFPIISKVSVDIGNVVNKRPNANNARGVSEYFIGGREVKGSFDPEITPVIDYWNYFKNTEQIDIAFEVGSGAGKVCGWYLSQVILEPPALGERENILTQEIKFSAHPLAGNDEIQIYFV